MSHNCFVYLDDGISGSPDYVSARAASMVQRKDLAAAGFVTNEEKSKSPAVGPIARLFTRQMHYAIQSRPYWDATFVFSDPLLQELKFWLQNIDSFQ